MTASNSTIQGVAIDFAVSTEFRIAKITLYVVIFTLSCIGNSLVAIVIIGAKGMRTAPNLLILNLAFCDLITPAMSIPFDLALEELHYMWPFGRAMCKVLWPFQTISSTSSSLTLAVISLDRFRALAKPLVERVSTSRILMSLLAIHVVSICLCIPYFIVLEYNDSEKSCDERWSSTGYRQAYTISLFLFQFALPLTTMSIAYLLIYRSLRSNVQKLFFMNARKQRTRTTSKTSNLSMDCGELKVRREQNIHLARMFVIVVVVFAISMSPNQFFWLWMDFGKGADNKFHHYASVMCRLSTYANSVLNPFIYALKSREFRSGFARIGRQSMQPLRKISNETRKFVRKISGSPQQSGQQHITDHPSLLSPNSNSSIGRERHELDVIKCLNEVEIQDNNWENMNVDESFMETLLRPGSNRLFEELRESNC